MKVFVDTGYWYALSAPADQHHQASVRAARRPGLQPVTTALVVHETLALFQKRGHFASGLAFLERVVALPAGSVVHASAGQTERAWGEWRRRGASGASPIDCASFVVMRDLGLSEVFSFDHHFAAAGFRTLQ